ncbi:hypothetical protein [Arthrobacter sp. StoSoilB5]|uniref:DUF7255 family protein n=1 Tax=Arthrobacter sp. StoSoilB5 TaxID=2830992 RepID=UPI001CC502E8|nr:hypothetical protein [Arthrobacter sp. StoSoilB5]
MTLVPAPNYDWIGTRGPFGLATQSGPLFDTVLEMAQALDGYLDVMRSPKRTKRADFDLIHEPTGIHIEVDEEQHFSTHRLKMLDFYGPDVDYGFDLEEYRALCRLHGPRIDRTGWAANDTVNFGPRSRAKQGAFYDSMKDLVLPAMGIPHVIRVEVIDREPELAWALNRERISAALAI